MQWLQMSIRLWFLRTRHPEICEVFKRYPEVDKAVLYGSRAKATHKNGSDIDLTLHGGRDLTLNVLLRIANDLDDLFLPYTFDLSIFRKITDPDVTEHIRRVGITMYERILPSTLKRESV